MNNEYFSRRFAQTFTASIKTRTASIKTRSMGPHPNLLEPAAITLKEIQT